MPPSWQEGLVDAFPIPADIPQALKARGSQLGSKDVLGPLKQVFTSAPSKPFPFFDLPSELRNRVYRLVLLTKAPYRGADGRRRGSRLTILLASKRFHQEASYVLYTSHSFRIFKLQDFLPLPAIQELPPHYRSLVTNLEMRVGSSWTSPPRTWRVSKFLARCLGRLPAVQTLRVFVEADPSQPIFEKHRISYDFYTNFCGDLLRDALKVMPQLRAVELDGNPGVDVNGPLVTRLRVEAEQQGKTVYWGTQNGWAEKTIKPRVDVQ